MFSRYSFLSSSLSASVRSSYVATRIPLCFSKPDDFSEGFVMETLEVPDDLIAFVDLLPGGPSDPR